MMNWAENKIWHFVDLKVKLSNGWDEHYQRAACGRYFIPNKRVTGMRTCLECVKQFTSPPKNARGGDGAIYHSRYSQPYQPLTLTSLTTVSGREPLGKVLEVKARLEKVRIKVKKHNPPQFLLKVLRRANAPVEATS